MTLAAGLVHGYTTAFTVSAGLLVAAAFATVLFVRASGRPAPVGAPTNSAA